MRVIDSIPLLLFVVMVASACNGGDVGRGTAVESTQAAGGSTTTMGTTSTVAVTTTEPVVEETALYPDLPGIMLLTPAMGGGPRPLLEWSPVDGATRYDVILSKQDGTAYWAWSGPETSVVVGQISNLDAPGPRIGGEMSWFVIAFSDDGSPIAASGIRPIAP